MVRWFWYFFFYSFLGFLVEVLFAQVTRNPKRDRKCYYFLPLCPVYGFGAIAILLLPGAVQRSPLLLFPCSALACSAVEYLTDVFYERVSKVRFWDYAHLPLNLNGRVCLLFGFFWGVLALVLLRVLHPRVALLVEHIPLFLFFPAAGFLCLDACLTFYILRRRRSTEALRWYLHLRRPSRRAA